jgi:phage baseplate assembly protein W
MATYTDLNANFKMDAVNANSISYDLQTVRNSLQRLLSTGKGEVPFNREYGTTLKSLLFENNVVPADIAAYLYMDITTWEPRVQLSPADIDIIQTDRNTFLVKCTFTVVGINGNPQTVTQVITNG